MLCVWKIYWKQNAPQIVCINTKIVPRNLLEQPLQLKNIFSKSSHKIPKQSQTHPRTRYFVLTLFCNLFDGDKNVKTWVSIQSKKKNTSYNNLRIRHHFILSFFFSLTNPIKFTIPFDSYYNFYFIKMNTWAFSKHKKKHKKKNDWILPSWK